MKQDELINRHWTVVKYYGRLMGIWPFDEGWKKRALQASIYICLASSLFTLTSRIIVYYSFSVVTEQIPFMCVALIMLFKHANCVLNHYKFVEIMQSIIEDWREKKTDEEILIMEAYSERGVFFVLLYRINIYFGVAGFALVPFISPTLDFILPRNESRPRLFAYEGYYYVDPIDNYYYIVAFNFVQILLAGVVLISTDIFMIQIVQHACALLLLAGHRFKYAVNSVERRGKRCSSEGLTYRKLRNAFRSHNRAMQHLAQIESAYAMNLVLQLLVMTMSFSVTLFEVAVKDMSLDMFRYYAFLISQIIHMLFLTMQGQFVLDSHDVVYKMIYESMWYDESPKLQLLYVLALRRSLTPALLTVGGLMPLDLNSFAELVKLCVSYYTVLKSR